jgi:hypothetical protein
LPSSEIILITKKIDNKNEIKPIWQCLWTILITKKFAQAYQISPRLLTYYNNTWLQLENDQHQQTYMIIDASSEICE